MLSRLGEVRHSEWLDPTDDILMKLKDGLSVVLVWVYIITFSFSKKAIKEQMFSQLK